MRGIGEAQKAAHHSNVNVTEKFYVQPAKMGVFQEEQDYGFVDDIAPDKLKQNQKYEDVLSESDEHEVSESEEEEHKDDFNKMIQDAHNYKTDEEEDKEEEDKEE